MLTQSKIKELLQYDEDTGDFTWNVSRGGVKLGDKAGHNCLKNSKFYTIIGINGSLYRAHRLAFLYVTGSFPTGEVDHINGSGIDNRWVNLREVDRLENGRNMRLHAHNSSGISGVSWRKQRGKWRAFINIDNVQRNLGHFKDFFEACCARKSAECKLGFHVNHGRVRPL